VIVASGGDGDDDNDDDDARKHCYKSLHLHELT
jgi:hypothetical protein